MDNFSINLEIRGNNNITSILKSYFWIILWIKVSILQSYNSQENFLIWYKDCIVHKTPEPVDKTPEPSPIKRPKGSSITADLYENRVKTAYQGHVHKYQVNNLLVNSNSFVCLYPFWFQRFFSFSKWVGDETVPHQWHLAMKLKQSTLLVCDQ